MIAYLRAHNTVDCKQTLYKLFRNGVQLAHGFDYPPRKSNY
jgi:hypothetical protein